jgi:non-homologous end joining protein Ku
MVSTRWKGLLRLSLVFCPIGLSPVVTRLAEEFSGSADNLIDIGHFVPRDQIDQTYIGGAYYVYPEGQSASDTLHALRIAMVRKARVAVGRVKIGDRDHSVLIEPYDAGLIMSLLHTEDERAAAEFTQRAETDIPGEMTETAEDIISRFAGDFDHTWLERRPS